MKYYLVKNEWQDITTQHLSSRCIDDRFNSSEEISFEEALGFFNTNDGHYVNIDVAMSLFPNSWEIWNNWVRLCYESSMEYSVFQKLYGHLRPTNNT